MTQTVAVNAYAMSLSLRYDAEVKNAKSASSLNFISKCALVVSQKSVAEMLAACEVKTDFAQDSVQANSAFCMKALENCAHILEFAVNARNVDKLKSNVEEVLRTMINFKKNSEQFAASDIEIALDKNIKVAKERAHLYFRRKDVFSSAKRHASMNMRALVALNLLKAVSKDKYEVNDNALTQAIEARFAA
ncbi:hypothetical protein HJB53_30330 [Rhizobium lentis]|uniref:hypothetical protein n=1 Tax=Rhizobium lentis TaxID=1138194 RepID=UPI001C839F76|nr:hypothetical protein [Rhizobium lentis]MBX5130790.1 hypothetical protein [Rhizobium lentis]